MRTYKHLFFDLDHTLWDYDANATETLKELYEIFRLEEFGLAPTEIFLEVFFRENGKLWQALDVGKIDKFYLRKNRFRIVLESSGGDMQMITEDFLMEINDYFLKECSQKKRVINGAFEVLDFCRGKFDLHIITNGFEEVQSSKLEHSGLNIYFDKIITSEKAGHKKPSAGIYHYALKHTRAELEKSLMIGDNLQTDIKGARDFGMDQVFFNPLKQKHEEKVTSEISTLPELMKILSD